MLRAWAGVVGDVVDLVPFVTGIGESVKVVRYMPKTAKVVESSYEILYESGKNYVGKGGLSRAITSAKEHAQPNVLNNFMGDNVISIKWKSAPDSKTAFIEEYKLQLNGNKVLTVDKFASTYNKIWSPGRKY